MLKMIIADDEPIITKGIRMLLDWEQLGVWISGTYENGQKALQAIMTEEPDIAILDIAMPGKSGIDILKEIFAAGYKTKVIFLSGFQEFQYAQAALRYEAADYLLKPVKKENLISAVGKCIRLSGGLDRHPEDGMNRQDIPQEAYKRLAYEEQTPYILVAVKLPDLEEKSNMERQLIRFAVFGSLEEAVEQRGIGIAFQKEDRTFIVLKGMDKAEAYGRLLEIYDKVQASYECRLGFVMGSPVQELRQIVPCAPQCTEMLGYFYFADQLDSPVLEIGKPVYAQKYSDGELIALRDELLTEIFRQNRENTERGIRRYLRGACVVSGSRGDTAVYYLLSCIRAVEERMESLDIPFGLSKVAETMEKARLTATYVQLEELFTEIIAEYCDRIAAAMQKDEKRDIILAKQYIEEHYAENITLETMSKQIHINSFYFSSFFKKHTGQNFKDYLNQVRMKHAMELLMSTAKKSYEISEEVGFKDYRYFSELFSRYYGKTPTAYRKQHRDNNK